MVTTYIIVIAASVWLLAFLLGGLCRPLAMLTHRAPASLAEWAAYFIILGFLVVVAAPAWILLISIALAFIAPRIIRLTLKDNSVYGFLFALLVLMIVLPLTGAASWLALDAAIVGAAFLGASQAQKSPIPVGRTFVANIFLMGSLIADAVISEVHHAS